jgi:serine/threonine-protein kinase
VRAATVFIGRYELGPLLGQGGMARVHRGTDRRLGRAVAIIVLAEPFDRDRAFVARFEREARAAARLSHPNIVSVFDTGSDHGTPFIVMELVDGVTLADRLAREGPLPPSEAARISAEVAQALAAAHGAGVIHRDVKPGNVMLSSGGGVKVVDFGIAHASSAEEITRTGVVLGSPRYLSPEQAQGAPGDERSDLYGVGCVLYEMLTGRPPFEGGDPIATLYRHVHEDPVPPSAVRPVPRDLERVVLRCLEKDPARRFASAAELETAVAAPAADVPSATLEFPAADGAPSVPMRARGSERALPVSVGAGQARTQARSTPRRHHGAARTQGRPWPMVWLAVGVGLIVGLTLLLYDAVRLPTMAELREASQAPQTAADPTVATTSDARSPTPAASPIASYRRSDASLTLSRGSGRRPTTMSRRSSSTTPGRSLRLMPPATPSGSGLSTPT